MCSFFCRFMCCSPDPPTPLHFRAYIYHLVPPAYFVLILSRLLSVFLRVVWFAFDTEESLADVVDEYILTRTKYLCIPK